MGLSGVSWRIKLMRVLSYPYPHGEVRTGSGEATSARSSAWSRNDDALVPGVEGLTEAGFEEITSAYRPGFVLDDGPRTHCSVGSHHSDGFAKETPLVQGD